jgi:hypothetical protein
MDRESDLLTLVELFPDIDIEAVHPPLWFCF